MRVFPIYTIIICGCAFTGCIRLTGPEYVPGPDPMMDQAVTVTNVSGNEVTLSDGSRYHVAGIRAWETPDGYNIVTSELRNRIVHTEQIRLLKQGSGVRLMITHYNLPTRPFGLILFPEKKPYPPQHADVAVELLRNGFARVAPKDIDDAEVLRRYEAAEQEAMKGRAGNWAKAQPTSQDKKTTD